MSQPGTAANPLRIAIVGSGPTGFYAADFLLKQKEFAITVDLFDRLPTPFGLVRGGVAPDHLKIKTVIKAYERTAALPGFRFMGNVAFGRDVARADLEARYHAVLYCVGAETDRRMGIPGEDLANSHPATQFVGWYNAHPDYRDLHFDLAHERVAVVGNGNVAMDVIRILCRSQNELGQTDIADHAMQALARSRVREVIVLGRRGPAQAAYTNPEIRELGEMEEAEVTCPIEDATPDALTRAWMERNPDRTVQANVEAIGEYARRPSGGKPRTITFRFLVSPVELLGHGRVEAVKIVKNRLHESEDGSLRPKPTGEEETIPIGMIFRSVGYMGLPLPGLPFDQRNGVLPNVAGRIIDPAEKQPITGAYCAGWIKRGPSGVIGTNKPCAQETCQKLLEDVGAGKILSPALPDPASIEALLHERGIRFFTYADWQEIDRLELERGAATGRPRVKFSRTQEMIEALAGTPRH